MRHRQKHKALVYLTLFYHFSKKSLSRKFPPVTHQVYQAELHAKEATSFSGLIVLCLRRAPTVSLLILCNIHHAGLFMGPLIQEGIFQAWWIKHKALQFVRMHTAPLKLVWQTVFGFLWWLHFERNTFVFGCLALRGGTKTSPSGIQRKFYSFLANGDKPKHKVRIVYWRQKKMQS